MTRHRLLTTSVAVLATALTAVAVPAMAGPPPGEITEFTVPTATGQLMGIAGGTDGNVWFVETSAKKIGRVTPAGAFQEFPIPNNNDAWMITAGPDGNMWFTQPGANQIGRVTSDGVFDEFAIPTPASLPYGIAAGPDGNVWFVENSANKIGRITPAGVVTEFDIPTPASNAYNIVTGDDGNLWFTENGANTIGRISPTGTIHEFEVPTTSSLPDGITAGPDGNVWFTEFSGNKVGRITPDGSFTEFSVPTAFAGPQGIATGADGNLWITEYSASKVAQVTPEGVMVEFPVPNGAGSFPGVMSTGPDGNMWFTEKNSHKVGSVTTGITSAGRLPVLAGSGQVGLPLVCAADVWGMSYDTGVSWQRDGKLIAGQTGVSYTPTQSDLGSQISCMSSGTTTGMLTGLMAKSNLVTVVAQLTGPAGPPGPPGQNGSSTATLAAVWAPGTHSVKAGKTLKVQYGVTNAVALQAQLKGKKTITKAVNAKAGTNTLKWKLPKSLKSGKYSLSLVYEGKARATTKVKVTG